MSGDTPVCVPATTISGPRAGRLRQPDVVIDNSGTGEETRQQVEREYKRI